MNLRHKKPINSYRGQANNDKNEFNDDDFKHQPSPSKKLITSSGQQIYKYSKILAKFIMNANQFYRQKNKNPRKSKSEIENILQEAKVTRDESRNLKYVKRPQQPKQKRKIMTKIQNEKLQIKEIKQKDSFKIESQSKPNKNIKQLSPPKSIPKNQPIKNTPPPQSQPTPQVKIENAPLQKKTVTQQIPQNFMNIYGQGMPLTGFPNPALFANMPINQYIGSYEDMMRFTMLQQLIKNEQMKGMNLANLNPQLMASMMASADLMNLKQNMYQTYLRGLTPPQPAVVKKPPPIHNLTEVFLKRKQSIFNQSKQKPNEMVKRANFHVGIAYHIYLKQLENIKQDISDIEYIDPTRKSRMIKARQFGNKKYDEKQRLTKQRRAQSKKMAASNK